MTCFPNWVGFANDACCNNLVQDKVCLIGERTLAAATIGAVSEQIYFSNTRISATGYFKLLSTPTPTTVVTLSFLYNNVPLIIPAGIDTLSGFDAVAFTVVNFNEIRIDANEPGTIQFELSLTPRYTL